MTFYLTFKCKHVRLAFVSSFVCFFFTLRLNGLMHVCLHSRPAKNNTGTCRKILWKRRQRNGDRISSQSDFERRRVTVAWITVNNVGLLRGWSNMLTWY